MNNSEELPRDVEGKRQIESSSQGTVSKRPRVEDETDTFKQLVCCFKINVS